MENYKNTQYTNINTANDARRFNFFLKGNATIKVEATFTAVTDINPPSVVVT